MARAVRAQPTECGIKSIRLLQKSIAIKKDTAMDVVEKKNRRKYAAKTAVMKHEGMKTSNADGKENAKPTTKKNAKEEEKKSSKTTAKSNTKKNSKDEDKKTTVSNKTAKTKRSAYKIAAKETPATPQKAEEDNSSVTPRSANCPRRVLGALLVNQEENETKTRTGKSKTVKKDEKKPEYKSVLKKPEPTWVKMSKAKLASGEWKMVGGSPKPNPEWPEIKKQRAKEEQKRKRQEAKKRKSEEVERKKREEEAAKDKERKKEAAAARKNRKLLPPNTIRPKRKE